ncbi:YkvA family protein [Bacillus marinisedimentorum]|uniref:YkvA family protein n=1 Tax=Bacillus marinisedimentorum TaxID=1821260 RepID=UPI0007DF1620|nr:YkvA family protein [Bacillus marinisedimentorum]
MKKQAVKYLFDKKKGRSLADKAEQKSAGNKGILRDIREKSKLLIQLLRAYLNGDYRDVSKKTMITVVGGLLYLVLPTDAVPDFLFATGLIDDAAILGLVLAQVNNDLEKFKAWKEGRRSALEIDPSE